MSPWSPLLPYCYTLLHIHISFFFPRSQPHCKWTSTHTHTQSGAQRHRRRKIVLVEADKTVYYYYAIK